MTAGTEAAGVRAGVGPARRVPWAEVRGLALIALQLVVCLLLARGFVLEHAAFHDVVLPLAIGGFLVHHWLPRRYQTWFFLALSLAGIVLVLGAASGAWLIGIGLGLIGLCHVPIAFRGRVLLVLAGAGVLLAMRSAWLPSPWPGVIWPILGSIFMFRLGIYLYDLKYSGPASPSFVLSYFFMLPNTVFLLFPVIDFQTFRRTYYDRPALEIYGEGVRWMLRGMTHLVLYRLIYQNVAISPADVTSTAGIVQYLVANFGLYLRVSGQFHVITGMLHLFGFRLPESHRFFYLASSFSDLWRRINIYWKDFMQKMVYLPVFFGSKRRGETTALVLATISVVAATWFLHSYQWFWLLGTWLFSATDAGFWGLIGVFLIISTLAEQRRGRVRQLTAQAGVQRHAVRLALQTAGMFGLMALLWGLWTSPTFADFRVLLGAATLRPVDVAVVLGVLGVVALAAFISQRYALGAPSALSIRRRSWQHPLLGALPLACFWVAGVPALADRVPDGLRTVAQRARGVELNTFDAERLQRGYYEEIVGVNRFNGELWEVYARGEKDEDREHEGLGGFMDDGYGNRCFLPHVNTMFKGGRFITNRWGIRDRDYEKEPGPNTRRIAVLGPSYVMGSGVNNGEPFEQLVEDRLNGEWFSRTGLHYEFLNFGLPWASVAEIAAIVDSGRVASFKPSVVLVVGNMYSEDAIENDLWRRLKNDQPLPESLDQVLPAEELAAVTTEAELERLVAPHGEALVRWALNITAEATRRMEALPVYALIPMPFEPFDFPHRHDLLQAAGDAGFIVIDMRRVFDGQPREKLVLSSADRHPNADGHRVIANRLYTELMAHPEILATDS